MSKHIIFPIQSREDLGQVNLFLADDEITVEHALHQLVNIPYILVTYTKNRTKKKKKKAKK